MFPLPDNLAERGGPATQPETPCQAFCPLLERLTQRADASPEHNRIPTYQVHRRTDLPHSYPMNFAGTLGSETRGRRRSPAPPVSRRQHGPECGCRRNRKPRTRERTAPYNSALPYALYPGATAGCGARPTTSRLTGTFIRRRAKKASTAAVRSKAMEMLKTPTQPIFGMVNLPAKGVQILGTTVRAMP